MRPILRALPNLPRILLPLAVLPALLPAEAVAQYGRTFWNDPKLSTEDTAIIRKLVREDLTGKPNGTTLSWSNPESENSGTVTLIDSFASSGRDCRRVRYIVEPGPKQASFARTANYVLTNCRLPDGTWKIDNEARPDAAR